MLCLSPFCAYAGGMGTSSNNELITVFLATVAVIGILYGVNQSLKYWNKPLEDETLNEENPE